MYLIECKLGGWSMFRVRWLAAITIRIESGRCDLAYTASATGSAAAALALLHFRDFFFGNGLEYLIKVVDLRPVRSAWRVKKVTLKPLKICVCYGGSTLLFKVIKIHPVLLADVLSILKNSHNANFAKILLKQAF